jgi:hypothetical protein
VWTNRLTSSNGFHSNYPAANAFDGSVTDNQVEPASSGGVLTFTPSTAISYTTSVEFMLAGGNKNYSVNGGATQTSNSTGDTWTTAATGSGTLTSLAFWKPSDWPSLRGIRVDGKLLVDAGLIPVGSLNSSLYEQSAVWSNMVTCSGSAQSGTTFANIFDGNASTQFGTATGGAYTNAITFTPTTAINYTSSVKLISPSGQMAARINGGSWVSYTTNVTLATGSGTINSIEVTERRSNAGFGWNQLEIDGKIYVDQGVTPPSSTNLPSIASTCRSNQSAGTSIVSYTGNGVNNSSIAHNLNAKPSLIVTKNLDGAYNWITYHSDLADTKVLALDGDYSQFTPSGGYYGDVTSTTYKVIQGSSNLTNLNNSGDRYISYCFAPVEGVSAMGKFQGNGSSDGVFVPLSFKPSLLMIKQINGVNGWFMWDEKRDPANPNTKLFSANAPNIEGDQANHAIDFLSNGFKARDQNGAFNGGGNTYIYIAFASSALKHQSRAN